MEEFLKTLSDIELIVLQKEACEVQDEETLNKVLNELGQRRNNG